MNTDSSDKRTVIPERGNETLRFLDRFFGIPLLFVMSLYKRKHFLPSQVSRIAILKTAAIGDTVLISAIVTDLKHSWPSASITFFCGASNQEAAAMLAGVDEVVLLPLTKPLAALKLLRQGFDVLLDFGQWPRLDALLAGLCGARFTVGFCTRGQHRHFLFDATVPHHADRHEMENFRALLGPLQVRGEALPSIPFRTMAIIPKQAVLHMFPGGLKSYLKEWPVSYWQELIDQLTADGWTVVLTGGPGNRSAAVELQGKVKTPERVKVVAGQSTLKEVVELLVSSRLLITVNTGIMHLAAALGCKIISLNGPTSVKRWGPYAAQGVALQSPRPCSPCLNLGFEYGCDRNDCMKDLSVHAVLRSLD